MNSSWSSAIAVYRGRSATLALLVGLGLATSGFEIAALTSLYFLLSLAVGSGAAQTGSVAGVVTGVLARIPVGEPFFAALILYVACDSAHCATSYAQRVLSEVAALEIRDSYHRRFFDTYADAEYQLFLNRSAGDLKHWILFAPVQIGEFAVAIPQLVTQTMTLVCILALLLAVSVPLTLGSVALSGLLFVAYERLGRRRMYDFGIEKVRLRQTESRLVAEALEGIKHFRVYGHVDRWISAFSAASAAYGSLLRRIFTATTAPSRALTAASVVAFGALLLALRWATGSRFSEIVPALVLCYIAAQRLLPVVAGLVQARAQVVENLVFAERATHEMEQRRPAAGGRLTAVPLADGIRFDGVTLAYLWTDPILRDVSFLCRAGTHTAIVGPSGCGKSSLLNLLVRLFEPASGAVRVGAIDLREMDAADWRRRIGFVAQESFLFHGTIAENIAFGRHVSREMIEHAARLAGLNELIGALPRGYDTLVGEQGLTLSGGQRQRVGIARAVLTQPEILIFDEATSALDGPTEAFVLQAIANVSRGRTVITVAHRLSSIAPADRIVVIHHGGVAEQGTHDELMSSGGTYFALYRNDATGEGSRLRAG